MQLSNSSSYCVKKEATRAHLTAQCCPETAATRDKAKVISNNDHQPCNTKAVPLREKTASPSSSDAENHLLIED